MLKQFIRFAALGGLVAGCFLSVASETRAAFTFTAVGGGSAIGGVNYATFNNSTLGSGTTTDGTLTASFGGGAGGAAVVNGSLANTYAAPVFTGNNNLFFSSTPTTGTDTTNFLSAGTGSITLTFGAATTNYLGLLWGSVDSYNSLTFFDANGNVVGSITGTMVNALTGGNTTGTYVNVMSTTAFTRVVASSALNSFEIDNVAYGNFLVPEPSSVVLCGLAGLIGLGVARVRGKKAIA